ncbi:type II toxin-antitoxin system SpoIISB family antitoxin [Bacillus licheniformis]|nr:type II toxin-antitoxin system SpoIISB family antitoxin [Bacillus licheniformis]
MTTDGACFQQDQESVKSASPLKCLKAIQTNIAKYEVSPIPNGFPANERLIGEYKRKKLNEDGKKFSRPYSVFPFLTYNKPIN